MAESESMVKIRCRHLEHWRENQSPLGSGEYWPMDMEDCSHPGFDDEQKQIALEGWDHCDETCPGYEPEELGVCPKHGNFIKRDGCEECMFEEQYQAELPQISARPGTMSKGG